MNRPSIIAHIPLEVHHSYSMWSVFNTLRPRQNGRHFAGDTFKHILLNENVWIAIKISLKFVPKGPINNIPALIQIMAWRRSGDKPLSELMMVSLLTHICALGLNELTHWGPAMHLQRCIYVYKYRYHPTRPLLVKIMACHLFGTKPSSEPMTKDYKFNNWE